MRFVLHVSALNSDDSTLGLIDRIVDRVADEVHLVSVPDADLLQNSSWYAQARSTRRKILTKAVATPARKAAVVRGPHVKAFEVTDVKSARLAEKLAHTPLEILVEDREADGVLLDIVVEELGWPELRTLWERSRKVTPRAAEIVSSAGKDHIPQRVERAYSDAASEHRPARLFVICETDFRWPNDDDPELTKKAEAIRLACKKYAIPFHVLWKRCAENYIPDKVLEAVRDDPRNLNRVKGFNALLRRKPLQRDHFPIKGGLSARERAAAIKAGLYDQTEESELLTLEERLFAKRPRPLLRLSQERRTSFTADGLRERDNRGELDILLQNLAKEL